jgi:predicted nuclease of predicted toxin-antitoxin system
MLRQEGHACWTAGEASLTETKDDSLTVYADERDAVLVTMDKEFSERRRLHSIGRHVWLRCLEPEAADVLRSQLGDVLPRLEIANVTITVSKDGVRAESAWE